jgi:uncharacterized protein YecT (DUF1311 family)
MLTRKLLAASAAILLTALPVTARDAHVIDCANATSTVEMNFCAEEEFDKADAALNKAYQTALAAIPSLAGEHPFDAKSWENALRASQRAWLAFRDAECDQHVPMFWTGGTGTSSAVTGCTTEKTRARTEELKEQYEPE